MTNWKVQYFVRVGYETGSTWIDMKTGYKTVFGALLDLPRLALAYDRNALRWRIRKETP